MEGEGERALGIWVKPPGGGVEAWALSKLEQWIPEVQGTGHF